VLELNVEIDVTDSLTLSMLSSYNDDNLFTFQDYNRIVPNQGFNVTPLTPGGFFNDPQLGRSNQFRTFDISSGFSDQFSQEFRLSSSFDGPINFNVGTIYVNFDTQGDYYVFSNTLTAAAAGGVGTNPVTGESAFIDPSGIPPNGDGHNYFRSFQPYHLESRAAFGEVYYEPIEDLKFTLGLRYTKDDKTVETAPTVLLTPGRGFPVAPSSPTDQNFVQIQNVSFEEVTGRGGVDWQPDLAFTDDTLVYASYSRGYKAGGSTRLRRRGLRGSRRPSHPSSSTQSRSGPRTHCWKAVCN
jgi:outer membrane receptor protein involved in Fe transport